MGILQDMMDRMSGRRVLHTKYGDLNLARREDRQKMRRMVVDLHRMTDALTRKDLQDWRQAWQMAINVDSPNRMRLYDIYRDVDVDLHLSGCVGQRVGFVTSQGYRLVDVNGVEQEDATALLNARWFRQLMAYALESIYWGHSLIELGEVIIGDAGEMAYDGVKLIPRKHVIPEYGRVVSDIGQDWHSGIDYRSRPWTDWLIETGSDDGLGLYLKAATQTIPKKNALGFWDSFAEIFGMPMRIAHTTTRDDKEISKIEKMMDTMGAALWGVFQEGTDIDVVENTRGDAFNVYDRRIDRANSELSKLIIGQTMTIEDGSSLSQSQTHLKVFENIVRGDRDMIRDMVNCQLLPRMLRHGFPVGGLSFEWDEAVSYTPEQQLAFETAVADRYEVDGRYFQEKYNMPVGERREGYAMLPGATGDEDKDDEDKEKPEKKEDEENAEDGKKRVPFFD